MNRDRACSKTPRAIANLAISLHLRLDAGERREVARDATLDDRVNVEVFVAVGVLNVEQVAAVVGPDAPWMPRFLSSVTGCAASSARIGATQTSRRRRRGLARRNVAGGADRPPAFVGFPKRCARGMSGTTGRGKGIPRGMATCPGGKGSTSVFGD